MADDEDYLVDSENYRSGEENKFNHQVLVMKAMQKCLDLGSVEMIEGYWDEKLDKNGNVARTYHTDTRRAFIESVKSLMMVTYPDYIITDFKKTIDGCLVEIQKRKDFWLNEEWRWWASLNQMQQKIATKEGKYVNRGLFNPKLQFDNFFYTEELEIYRKICTTINEVIKELNYYGSEGKNRA